ncbi:MAG: hypothetical protein PVI40_07440 [Chlamydiota bacterium]|jgi:hypothetical protein
MSSSVQVNLLKSFKESFPTTAFCFTGKTTAEKTAKVAMDSLSLFLVPLVCFIIDICANTKAFLFPKAEAVTEKEKPTKPKPPKPPKPKPKEESKKAPAFDSMHPLLTQGANWINKSYNIHVTPKIQSVTSKVSPETKKAVKEVTKAVATTAYKILSKPSVSIPLSCGIVTYYFSGSTSWSMAVTASVALGIQHRMHEIRKENQKALDSSK